LKEKQRKFLHKGKIHDHRIRPIIDWTPDWFLGTVTAVVLVVIVATTGRWFNDTKEKSLISIDEDGITPEWFTLRMS
tara:strand:+ start:372 stop:602 length:231 start_codon:yes stop_codon:yes gene_type:complete